MNQAQQLVTFREPCDMTVAVSKAAEHLSGLGKYIAIQYKSIFF